MKDKLKEILKNPKDKLIAVDMDNTLCLGDLWTNERLEPIQPMIDLVNSLYMKGAHIIIFTARRPELYRKTHAWLMEYGVYFHAIAMQHKMGCDCMIDDRALNPEDLF